MTDHQIHLVRDSFALVRPIADQAAALFYDKLFERDPSVSGLFRGDMAQQGARLMQMIEGANGPCNPVGEKILEDKGIPILPDVLANSGGVTVSYYEWVQNKRSESWSEEEVDEKLEKAMKRAYKEVADFSRTKKVTFRIAAYAVALGRIQAVYKEREIFP